MPLLKPQALEFHGIVLVAVAQSCVGLLVGSFAGNAVAIMATRVLSFFRAGVPGEWLHAPWGTTLDNLRGNRGSLSGDSFSLLCGMFAQLLWSSQRYSHACLDKVNREAGIAVFHDRRPPSALKTTVLALILFVAGLLATLISDLARSRHTSFLQSLILLLGSEHLCISQGMSDTSTLLYAYAGLLCGGKAPAKTQECILAVMCTMYAKVYAAVCFMGTHISPAFDQNTVERLLGEREPKDRAWLTNNAKFIVAAFRRKESERVRAARAIHKSWARIMLAHEEAGGKRGGALKDKIDRASRIFRGGGGAFGDRNPQRDSDQEWGSRESHGARDLKKSQSSDKPPADSITAHPDHSLEERMLNILRNTEEDEFGMLRKEHQLFDDMIDYCALRENLHNALRPAQLFLRQYQHAYVQAMVRGDQQRDHEVVIDLLHRALFGTQSFPHLAWLRDVPRRAKSAPESLTLAPPVREANPLAPLLRQCSILVSGMLDQNVALEPGPPLIISWGVEDFHSFWIFLVSRVSTEFRKAGQEGPLSLTARRDCFASLENIRTIFSANPQGNLVFLGELALEHSPGPAGPQLEAGGRRSGGRRMSAPPWKARDSGKPLVSSAKARRVERRPCPFLAAAVDGRIYILKSKATLEKTRWLEIKLATGWDMDMRFLVDALIPKRYAQRNAGARRASEPLDGADFPWLARERGSAAGRVVFQDGRLSSEPGSIQYDGPRAGEMKPQPGSGLHRPLVRFAGREEERLEGQRNSQEAFQPLPAQGSTDHQISKNVEAILSQLNLSASEDHLLTALALAGLFESVVGISPQGELCLYTEYREV